MTWILELVGLWFATLTVGTLAMIGGYFVYDLLAVRRARRQITKHNTYDREYERFRQQALQLGRWASQLEEIQSLSEVRR